VDLVGLVGLSISALATVTTIDFLPIPWTRYRKSSKGTKSTQLWGGGLSPRPGTAPNQGQEALVMWCCPPDRQFISKLRTWSPGSDDRLMQPSILQLPPYNVAEKLRPRAI
jgi:hypothetical protein